MPCQRPDYEALDRHGAPYIRPAAVIHELPTPAARLAACGEATNAIAALLGLPALRPVGFGEPVYSVFMTATEARRHAHRDLLEQRGCDVSLNYCATYA